MKSAGPGPRLSVKHSARPPKPTGPPWQPGADAHRVAVEAKRDAHRVVTQARVEVRQALDEAAHDVREALDEAAQEIREAVDGIPVPIVPGTRVTEAVAQPPAPAAPAAPALAEAPAPQPPVPPAAPGFPGLVKHPGAPSGALAGPESKALAGRQAR